MRRKISALAIGWMLFVIVAGVLLNADAKQETRSARRPNVTDSDAFKFVAAVPDAKLHEIEVDQGLPDGLEPSDLLKELKLAETDLIWKGRLIYGDSRAVSMAICIARNSGKTQFFMDLNRDRVLETEAGEF